MKKFFLTKCFLFAVLISFNLNAQDVKIKISESSIQTLLNAFAEARYFSYGTIDFSKFFQYYSLRPKSVSFNILPNNEFFLTFTADFTANFEILLFNFEHQRNNLHINVAGKIDLVSDSDGYKIVLLPLTSSGGDTYSMVINYVTSGVVSNFPPISININEPLLPAIVGEYFTDDKPTLSTTNDCVELYLTLKDGPRYITAYNDVNQTQNVGNIEIEEGVNNFESYVSPKVFELSSGATKKIQTPDDLLDAQNGKNKYRHWYKGEEEAPLSEISTRRINIIAESSDETYRAQFDQAQRIQLSNSLEGIATGGTVTYESTTSSSIDLYDYRNITVQHPINSSVPNGTFGRNWYFSNWSDGNPNKNRTIKVDGDKNLTANYKGIQVANDASTYTNNSQRKIIRTEDGWLHQTYSSMGHVWLEHSTNNGTSWFLGNNGQPLDNGEGKNPSIDYWHDNIERDDYFIVVAYQQKIANNYSGLRYSIFKKTGSGPSYNRTSTYGKTIVDLTGESYTNNLNPGLTIGKFSNGTPYFALTYEKKSSTGGAPGIYWIYGMVSEYGFGIAAYINGSSQFLEDVISGPNLIDGTNANYSNASVNLNKSVSRSQGYFYVVYQKYISSTRSDILRSKLKCYSTASNSWLHNDYGSVKISNSADYKSYKPSMVEMSDKNIRVCWIRNLYGQSSMPYWMNAVYWRSNASSTYTVLGQFVRNISININDDYDLSTAKTPFVWSQDLYGWENYISNGSSYTKLSTTGYDVQMSNGINSGDMVVSAFNRNSVPYYFTNTHNIGTTYSKSSSNADITYGRGLALNKDELNFNYSIKSLMVDGESIKFVEIPESEPDTSKNKNRGIKYLKLKELNEMLLSEPFTIDERSEFLFTDDAGFIDTKAGEEVLGKNGNINCKIELIDDATGKVIGLINETEYSAANLPQGKISNYSLNTDGIGKKTARVKITISSNVDDLQGVFVSEYGTMDKQELAKAAAQKLELKNSELVTSYNLEQNYPNPFNPSTMIRYQLPKTSEVSLKVYDVLGKEVATLVNKTQAEGRYEVKFDASHLSSGVYIYRIEAGEYTASHKMMMLK